MKKIGVVLIVAGIVAAIFIYYFDLIVKDEETVVLGPRSGPALGASVLMVLLGAVLLIVRCEGGEKSIKKIENLHPQS